MANPAADARGSELQIRKRLMELHEELEVLNAEAHQLEKRIAENVVQLLAGEG